jgi:hypothetical protein
LNRQVEEKIEMYLVKKKIMKIFAQDCLFLLQMSLNLSVEVPRKVYLIGKCINIFAQDCKTCIGSQATALLFVSTAHCKSHKSQNLNGCFHEWITKSRFKAP